MPASPAFDAYDPAFVRDPYPTYARLRSLGPFRDDAWGLTFFSRHADVMGILRDDPAAAVEELLRYDAPLQMFERWVLEDLDWRGVPLRAGEKVGLVFGSANHDPDAFVDPERLDLGRFENPHVAFGLGTHHCLGAPLARLEVEVAVTVAARRLTVIEPVVDEPPPCPQPGVPGRHLAPPVDKMTGAPIPPER
ncbi:MAG: cytochrome P450 [Actinomycetota bacterium]